MPEPSLLVFSLPLKLCSHGSVDGEHDVTLSCAEQSCLSSISYHSTLIWGHSFFSDCLLVTHPSFFS